MRERLLLAFGREDVRASRFVAVSPVAVTSGAAAGSVGLRNAEEFLPGRGLFACVEAAAFSCV